MGPSVALPSAARRARASRKARVWPEHAVTLT